MIDEVTSERVEELFREQKRFFTSQETKSIAFRLDKLKKLKAAIKKYEERILEALYRDLHKSPEEAYLTEISVVLHELDHHIKNLKKWAKPEKVKTPLYLKPSRSRIVYEPLGVSLIIAPWNYPFQLLMNPLVGAISSGCCTVLKPSPDTPETARVMEALIETSFASEYITVAQGGKEANQLLLKKPFDFIFFTGSSRVGKIIMKAAAEHLTPVVLELGGKSPCIVDRDAKLDITAKRIAWGKTINAGQTCIAPDYLLVHESVKEALITKIGQQFKNLYGEDISKSNYYPKIVHKNAAERLQGLMNYGTVRTGGEVDIEKRFVAPTILEEVQMDSPLMEEEIFGPILPVIPYNDLQEAIDFVNSKEKPLAFYYFGKGYDEKKVLQKTTSGGGGINDTILHIANQEMPFGGVGYSGIGKYHGKHSFLSFSNARAVINTPTWIDIPFKYPPFKNFGFIKRFI